MQILHFYIYFYHYCRYRVNTYKYALRNGATSTRGGISTHWGQKNTNLWHHEPPSTDIHQMNTFLWASRCTSQTWLETILDAPHDANMSKTKSSPIGSPFVIMFPWNSEFKLQNHQRLSVWGLLIAWPGMRFLYEKWLVVAIFIGPPWAPMSQLMVANYLK